MEQILQLYIYNFETVNACFIQVKVYDAVKPTKAFLLESFQGLLDTDFTILGYHHSTSSTRFYLENNNAAAAAIKALDKRMQGSTGRLMQIQVEPCQEFLLLNGQQLAVIKQVSLHFCSP